MFPAVLRQYKSELGFTLIEVLTALAILAMVMGPATAAVITLMNLSSRSTDLNVHLRQVQNAGFWISQDALMAQTVTTGSPGVLLTLRWTDWDGNNYTVDYLLEENTLQRQLNGGGLSAIAEYIDPDATSCQWDNEHGQLTVTISSLGNSKTRVQKVYTVRPRAWVGEE